MRGWRAIKLILFFPSFFRSGTSSCSSIFHSPSVVYIGILVEGDLDTCTALEELWPSSEAHATYGWRAINEKSISDHVPVCFSSEHRFYTYETNKHQSAGMPSSSYKEHERKATHVIGSEKGECQLRKEMRERAPWHRISRSESQAINRQPSN